MSGFQFFSSVDISKTLSYLLEKNLHKVGVRFSQREQGTYQSECLSEHVIAHERASSELTAF